jgi:hypothetical protein
VIGDDDQSVPSSRAFKTVPVLDVLRKPRPSKIEPAANIPIRLQETKRQMRDHGKIDAVVHTAGDHDPRWIIEAMSVPIRFLLFKEPRMSGVDIQ